MAVIALKFFDIIPARLNIWLMLFTSCWISYMLRVNISLNLIAMVPPSSKNSTGAQCDNSSSSESFLLSNATRKNDDISNIKQAPRDIPHSEIFDWSPEKQALILGSYYWCYPVTSLIGGLASERWGPRYMVLLSTITSGILTLLSPPAARLHYVALVVCRLLLGFCGGFIYPALHVLVARWVPPSEKGKFISAMMGGTVGTVATWSLTGPLIENYGWASAFYVPGVITLVWCVVWWYLVADFPAEHPRITDAEKKYILDALGDKVQSSKGLPPFKSIMTSIPYIAMLVLHFGNLWGLYFILIVGPMFVSSVLGFQLTAAGVISSLPYLSRLICSLIFGAIGDVIVSRKFMSTTAIRKFFCLFSHVLPGVMLILLIYAGCSVGLSVALITLSMGFNGAATLTNLQNHQDLAPNYAGTLYGIANFFGSMTGFFVPMITAYYTRDGNGFNQWRPVFFIGASVYIVSAIFFVFLGSGKTQSWNTRVNSAESKDDKAKNGELKDMKETSPNVTPNSGV